MVLIKAYIQPLDAKDKDRGDKIVVLFNPGEYTLDKSNQFQSTAILGLTTPLTQFVSGNAETLTMDLFFDTFELGFDVRIFTSRLFKLLEIDPELHAPPRCKFIWGSFQFKATVEKITRRFTMFREDGTPVRATLNVTFKEYKTIAEQLSGTPRHSADRTKVRVLTGGDNIWLLAEREYGDWREWRRIAEANQIDNPLSIEAGRSLIVPPRS
jgi:hypothetical protein